MFADYFHDQVYLLSTATLLLAIIIALYFANFLKDENETDENQTQRLDYEGDNAATRHNNVDQTNDKEESENGTDTDYSQPDIGILGKLKSARWKSLEEKLTKDQLEEERRIEREQLAAIFKLLKKQESELNFKEIDKHELNAQLHLYR